MGDNCGWSGSAEKIRTAATPAGTKTARPLPGMKDFLAEEGMSFYFETISLSKVKYSHVPTLGSNVQGQAFYSPAKSTSRIKAVSLKGKGLSCTSQSVAALSRPPPGMQSRSPEKGRTASPQRWGKKGRS